MYYRGDGKGINLHLTLIENGSFECRWTGCLGEYGKCSGRWSDDGHHIKIRTKSAEGVFNHRPLTDLEVGQANGKTILIETNDKSFFAQYGASRYSCFHRAGEIPDR
jgi:hypothetical protein